MRWFGAVILLMLIGIAYLIALGLVKIAFALIPAIALFF